uniref:Phosphoprotein n=1 Tax=avian metapneumovirus TaxID=38525 RepID=A0A481Y5P9_9MONO|nr:phosphoprotein [Avian metapneumovirus]
MSYPKGEELILMGNEAAKAAEAYQDSLKKKKESHSRSIVGEPIATVSSKVSEPNISTISRSQKAIDNPVEVEAKEVKKIYPQLPSAPTDHELEQTTAGKKKESKKRVRFPDDIVGRYSKLEKEALELLSDQDDDDKESSILTFDEKEMQASGIEARLSSIEEKLSMILGLLKTLSIATSGPTAARDGIRDAMIGMREELIASIMADAKGRIAEMIKEEEQQRSKIGNGSVKLTEKAKELNKIVEDESSSGESEEEETEEEDAEKDDSDDIYSFEL